MSEEADLLITGGIVITIDGTRRVLADGAVAVVGQSIAAVGPSAEVQQRFPQAKRHIDARGMAVLPGFVDTHAHAGHALVKSLGASGDDWMSITGRIYARAADADFWRAEALLSGIERIKCGTTTTCLLLGGGPDVMRSDDTSAADAHCAAIATLGLREVLAVGVSRPPYPNIYLDWDAPGAPRERTISAEHELEVTEAVIRRWHGKADGRIRIAVEFPVLAAAAWAPGLARIAEAARALSRTNRTLFVQDGHRQGTIAAQERFAGIAGPDALYGHAIDLTEDDIAVLVRTGAKIAHNPSALMSVRGRCPAPELMARGVVVGIGSDAPAPDRPFDMFRHMFQAMRYHARHFRSETALPATRVLEMATIEGARALGLEAEIGSLEPGKKADIILVDLMKPHLAPIGSPVRRLATFANGADVDTVIVDGRVLMAGRTVAGVDERAIIAEAGIAAARAAGRIGLGEPGATWA